MLQEYAKHNVTQMSFTEALRSSNPFEVICFRLLFGIFSAISRTTVGQEFEEYPRRHNLAHSPTKSNEKVLSRRILRVN